MIVLVSDQNNNIFTKIVKANLMTLAPHLDVVEISTPIGYGDVYTASYVIERFASHMPKNTIFLSVIDGLNDGARIPIALLTKDEKIFVGFDNGTLTATIERFGIRQIRRVETSNGFPMSITESALKVLTPIAAKLSLDMEFDQVGDLYMTYYSLKHKPPKILKDAVEGEVSFINEFGSVETNIPFDSLAEIKVEIGDEIKVNKRNVLVTDDERDGENNDLILHNGICGYIEILSKFSRAEKLLKVHPRERLRLEAST